jgi:cell division septation protein DedD
MKQQYIIAGKTEGFDYSDAKIVHFSDNDDVDTVVDALRSQGYKIYVITREVKRIDDFIGSDPE